MSVSEFDIFIKNGTILTMDYENTTIEKGDLGISGDTIAYIGPAGDMEAHGARIIDAGGGILMPGLINGHTHAAMTLFRGLADDLPLMEWLNTYIFPVEQRMDAAFVYTGTLLACAEMILSGTTTFCDMYLFEKEVARAARKAGMRALVGEVLYDFDSPNYGPVEKGLAYTEELILKWQDDPLVSIAVEPHALFTCSPELLSAAHRLAQQYEVPLITHLAETKAEVQEIKNRYGVTPVEHLRSLNLLGPRLIADHGVHLNEREIEMLAEADVKIVHNPESNMKLASGVAPVPRLQQAGITVGLGTDGCASNNNLDLFAEMDTAAKLHKVMSGDATVMNAELVLRMATIEGAKALGIERLVGSLEIGKKADIIVLDTKKPHLTPMYRPYSHLIYAAKGHDVCHVIINGRLIMENRRLITLDLTDIMGNARERAQDVMRWIADPLS
jgi:5-methylthioadenosine/S-adenosylhomocysteine deaminase